MKRFRYTPLAPWLDTSPCAPFAEGHLGGLSSTAEHRIVAPKVTGSKPVGHPTTLSAVRDATSVDAAPTIERMASRSTATGSGNEDQGAPKLTGAQISAINRFPDDNPNPVLRMDDDGHLMYANPASAGVRKALGTEVGERVPADVLARLTACTADRGFLELTADDRTFAVWPVRIPDLGFTNLYGTDVTAERAIVKFPDENPNPVLRVSRDGVLIYANPGSARLIEGLGATVGQELPDDLCATVVEHIRSGDRTAVEVTASDRVYALLPVDVPQFGFVNVYGTDITAEKAITKFPGQNPNPVLRVDRTGRVLYANAASTTLLDGLRIAVGDPLPDDLCGTVLEHIRTGDETTVECAAGEHFYALKPVDVPEFGFVNVYGTDITAVRAGERLAAENERLLLNILPEPIARRLRVGGERMIADRFDDVTLMFADIVGFTQLSSNMSPTELVSMLNDVFTVFDGLVDAYGLEKVKTIGDAYMVVGGMPERSDDHTVRVASMALDLAAAVGRIDAAKRLGIRFRIGIHCGPVIAGVIGTKKFIYDVWGDTVNLASRMESLGVPGKVQITQDVLTRLGNDFRFERRGTIDVKGKGPTPTWFLVGRAEATSAPSVSEWLPRP